jgi:hypothetical protein
VMHQPIDPSLSADGTKLVGKLDFDLRMLDISKGQPRRLAISRVRSPKKAYSLFLPAR